MLKANARTLVMITHCQSVIAKADYLIASTERDGAHGLGPR
ncbi:hypothetical protein [Stutzerimonas stutzeri]|nr:hypothetical protein [Stutzerimonas stutzeri]